MMAWAMLTLMMMMRPEQPVDGLAVVEQQSDYRSCPRTATAQSPSQPPLRHPETAAGDGMGACHGDGSLGWFGVRAGVFNGAEACLVRIRHLKVSGTRQRL